MKQETTILIYDNDCLLCKTYTGIFVKTGLLPASGRQHFNSVDPKIFSLVDKQKSNNEIPFIDLNQQKVWYGVDALLEILGAKFPLLKKWGNLPHIKWSLQRCYKLISYNRKVIVAAAPAAGYDCSPDFNLFYRIFWLLLLFGFQWWMLLPIYEVVFVTNNFRQVSFDQVRIIYLSVLSLGVIFSLNAGKQKGMEFMGQWMMTITINTLLFLPVSVFHTIGIAVSPSLVYFYGGMASLFMYKEGIRRMRYLKFLPKHE